MNNKVKFAAEMGPLALFFIFYKFQDIIVATAVLVITSILAMILMYISEKKISPMLVLSTLLVGFFGGLTVFSQNDIFIKLKPTFASGLFALILFVSCLIKKPALRYLMDAQIKMSDKAWTQFSLRWGIFFLAIASANEFVWRNFDDDTWVTFKVVGILGCTFLFVLSQLPFLKKHAQM